MNEDDLTSAFAEIRATAAPPPHRLTPPAMLAAGRQARRRRRIATTAGGGLAVLAAVTIGIGIVNAAPSGQPVEPGDPAPTLAPLPSPPPTPTGTDPSILPTPMTEATVEPTP